EADVDAFFIADALQRLGRGREARIAEQGFDFFKEPLFQPGPRSLPYPLPQYFAVEIAAPITQAGITRGSRARRPVELAPGASVELHGLKSAQYAVVIVLVDDGGRARVFPEKFFVERRKAFRLGVRFETGTDFLGAG